MLVARTTAVKTRARERMSRMVLQPYDSHQMPTAIVNSVIGKP